MTSNGRRTQNIKSGLSQQPLMRPFVNFKLKLKWPNIKCFQMKATSNVRRLPNIKSGRSHEPFIWSYSNFELRFRRPKQGVQIV